jgi:hypothetical protein
LLNHIRLRGGNAGGKNGQTARSVQAGNLAARRKPFALQQLVDSLTQFERSGVDHPCGNLFAADFEQKVRHCPASNDHSILAGGVDVECERRHNGACQWTNVSKTAQVRPRRTNH